jgi:hypothetical protein
VYVELAGLALGVAGTSDQLVLRSRVAGASPNRTNTLSAEGWAILEAAIAVRALDDDPVGGREPDLLCALEAARPPIRRQDPLLELGDRLARLPRVAWQLTTQPHASITTLADLAAVGVLVNEAAHQSLQATARANGTGLVELGLHAEADAVTHRGNAWRAAHQQLRALRSPCPAVGGVRLDLLRVQDLLQTITSLETPTGRTRALLLEASSSGEDIAVWESLTLLRLDTTGEVLALGSSIPVDSIRDNPDLIDAKIHNKITQAPEASVETLRREHVDAGTNPDPFLEIMCTAI